MLQRILLFVCALAWTLLSHAQTGCPGCTVNLPQGLPVDTIFLPTFPDGTQGEPYDASVSFRFPKTTTPINAIDSTTPAGLPITQFEILSLDGLPPGLSWEPNQFIFPTATQTDGCIRVCGTPLAADSFDIMVNIRVTVFIIEQDASFPMRLYIAPQVSNTDGFSMTNFTGCGSTTVEFTNNIPSSGDAGFSYKWDFGDGAVSTEENPPPHTYDQPGQYIVQYQATIDTADLLLQSATVLSVNCTDLIGFGNPDLYLLVKSPGGATIFNSSPAIDNTQLPRTFNIGLPIGEGNYVLEVNDEDGGIKGSDDPCGSVSFNYLSGDTLVGGGFVVVLNFVEQIITIESSDTVIVYPQPPQPFVSAPEGFTTCAGQDTLLLVSSAGSGNHWWFNGAPIADADNFFYVPETSGYYQVEVITPYGCSAISDSALVEYYPLPAPPVYVNVNNSLRVADTLALPADYDLQWFLNGVPIDSATGLRYCATESGNYGLVVTDNATGCANFYAADVVFDPNFDCTVGTKELLAGQLRLFPNPASDWCRIEIPPGQEQGALQIRDVNGRVLSETNSGVLQFDTAKLPNGIYTVEYRHAGLLWVAKLVVLH